MSSNKLTLAGLVDQYNVLNGLEPSKGDKLAVYDNGLIIHKGGAGQPLVRTTASIFNQIPLIKGFVSIPVVSDVQKMLFDKHVQLLELKSETALLTKQRMGLEVAGEKIIALANMYLKENRYKDFLILANEGIKIVSVANENFPDISNKTFSCLNKNLKKLENNRGNDIASLAKSIQESLNVVKFFLGDKIVVIKRGLEAVEIEQYDTNDLSEKGHSESLSIDNLYNKLKKYCEIYIKNHESSAGTFTETLKRADLESLQQALIKLKVEKEDSRVQNEKTLETQKKLKNQLEEPSKNKNETETQRQYQETLKLAIDKLDKEKNCQLNKEKIYKQLKNLFEFLTSPHISLLLAKNRD